MIKGYGSHQPALRALALFTPITSVIEFGGGTHSTNLFLDRTAYPDLRSLATFESKESWAHDLECDDERHTVILEPADRFVYASAGMTADFIFIDCAPMRIRFDILRIALKLASIAAIHDCGESDVTGVTTPRYIKTFNSIVQTVVVSETMDLSELEIHG